MTYDSWKLMTPEDEAEDAHASLYRMLYGRRRRQLIIDDYMEAEQADEDQDRREEGA